MRANRKWQFHSENLNFYEFCNKYWYMLQVSNVYTFINSVIKTFTEQKTALNRMFSWFLGILFSKQISKYFHKWHHLYFKPFTSTNIMWMFLSMYGGNDYPQEFWNSYGMLQQLDLSSTHKFKPLGKKLVERCGGIQYPKELVLNCIKEYILACRVAWRNACTYPKHVSQT